MTVRKKLQHHITREHYARTSALPGGAGALGRRLIDHMVEGCEECDAYWRQLGRLQETVGERVDELVAPAEEVSNPREWSLTEEDLEEAEREEKEMRRRRRRSWEQKSILLNTPKAQRRERITGARTRYQSRLLAEGLLQDGRDLLGTAPKKAAERFALVPIVLRRATASRGPGWAWSMVLLAHALEANALRVAGELEEARSRFELVRENREERPLEDAKIAGEVASLEASLLMNLREYDKAAEKLGRARALFGAVGDKTAKAHTMLQSAILERELGEPKRAHSLLEEAIPLLNINTDLHLLLSATTERVNVLCDLDRAHEALDLLEGSVDLYEDAATPYAGVYYRALHGRTSLALERYEAAEEGLGAAVEGFLTLDRAQDAALAALDLARVHLLRGETKKVGNLAVSLAKRFASQGVPEAHKALTLLADAYRTEELSLALLARLCSTLSSR